MKYNFYIISLLFTVVYANYGSITGKVIDYDTHNPLIGANVIIENFGLGSACDNNGNFFIDNIPVGSYTIIVSMIGYSKISRANVNIYSNRETPLTFYLEPAAIKGDIITVRSGYFEKAKDALISTQTIDREEIRSDPIGVYDVQMMIHSLPSVVTATDQNNEIIVRGGGPGENLFIMDHLEIPNPNHFGEVGSGGGPVSILNTEFVERVDFFPGAYPARYGDKQSSVMDISLREGSYSDNEIDLEMSMAGVGLLFEGPFAKGKGSYIGSFRQSFLKHLIKAAGLTAVPGYYNSQLKVTYNLSNRKKIMLNVVGGNDYVSIEDENRPDMQGAENVNYKGYQYTVGITYKTLLLDKGYTLFSIGKTATNWNADVYSLDGGVKETFFSRNNIESDNFVKWDVIYKFFDNMEISSGLNFKYGEYKMNEVLNPDTVFFYNYDELNVFSTIDDYYVMLESNPNYNYSIAGIRTINKGFSNTSSGGLWKYAAYSQIKYKINDFVLMTGIRYDNVPFNNTSQFSPRIGLSYSISPITKINTGVGKYYQTPDYWMLMNPNNSSSIDHSYTNQQVIGLEHYFADDIRATLEFYNKEYYKKPIRVADTTPNPFDAVLGYDDIGTGRAKGIELFVQKKFANKWYGTLSYSYSKAEGKDYREDRDDYYPWDFDYENVFTLIGGYKINFRNIDWYKQIRNSNIFPYISWFPFMLSDQLEISFRYRYSGGRPYTPKVYDFNHRIWYEDSNIDLNAQRYDNYSRLDIMILRRFNFNNINITTFLDLQNIFDRNNDWERVYFDDGTIEMSYQFKQIPVGGIIIEF